MKTGRWIAAVALLGLAACGGEEEGERVELGAPQQEQQAERPNARANWTPELTAQIDSGNAAYAQGEYETAAEIFTAVTEENPELGVAWFGLYMAENAMGNEEAAQAALEKAESYSPGLGQMHDAATDSTERVPMIMEGHPGMEGHPPLDSTAEQEAPPLPETSGGQ